jgi:hypothetical protein
LLSELRVSIAVSNEAALLTGVQLEFPKVFTLLAGLQLAA